MSKDLATALGNMKKLAERAMVAGEIANKMRVIR